MNYFFNRIKQKLPCPPSIRCSLVVKADGRLVKLLLRGDANGRVCVFSIPEVTDNQLEQIQQLDFDNPPSKFALVLNLKHYLTYFYYIGMTSQSCSSLADSWLSVYPKPIGVLSHVVIKYFCPFIVFIKS